MKRANTFLHIPLNLQANHYPSLDGIRAISILLVLSAHLFDYYQFSFGTKTTEIVVQTGLFGVQIFFLISGFLITTLLLKEKITSGVNFFQGNW